MGFSIETLTDADLAEVRRCQSGTATEWQIGRLHAWAISVADHGQRLEIEQAIAFQGVKA